MYIGSKYDVQKFELLKGLGITHIINLAISQVPVYFPDNFIYYKVEMVGKYN